MQYTLKELRARKNETQKETAKALGISPQTYNNWEKSISNISLSKAVALAEYFNVNIGDLKIFNH